MIKGVSQVSLNVSVMDQEKAKDFWIKTIGFELVDDQLMGNERWIRVTPPDHKVVLVLGGPNPFLSQFHSNMPTMLPHSPVFFECDDIRKSHKELADKGVKFAQPPVEMFFGWWALFCDPDGNRFALNQSKK